MLCKRRRSVEILSNCKRPKIISQCRKRKFSFEETSERIKIPRIEIAADTDERQEAQQTQQLDEGPYLVITEIEPPKIKNNVWDDSLCGPEPRNHFARNHFASRIQCVCKGWLIRKKNFKKNAAENLIDILDSLHL